MSQYCAVCGKRRRDVNVNHEGGLPGVRVEPLPRCHLALPVGADGLPDIPEQGQNGELGFDCNDFTSI